MEEENKVSVWFGNFDSEEAFDEFMEVQYDRWGDVSSTFMSLFDIDSNFIDNKEALFSNNLTKENLGVFSFSDFFSDQIEVDFSKYNCVVLVYDYNYSGFSRIEKMQFAGVFNYR